MCGPAPIRLPRLKRAGIEEDVAEAVRARVDRQVRAGLDIVNDGELAKISYVTYVRDRLTGFTPAAEPTRPRDDPL